MDGSDIRMRAARLLGRMMERQREAGVIEPLACPPIRIQPREMDRHLGRPGLRLAKPVRRYTAIARAWWRQAREIQAVSGRAGSGIAAGAPSDVASQLRLPPVPPISSAARLSSRRSSASSWPSLRLA